MFRELFLLVIPFVEVVEYGFAPRRAEEILVVLFVCLLYTSETADEL